MKDQGVDLAPAGPDMFLVDVFFFFQKVFLFCEFNFEAGNDHVRQKKKHCRKERSTLLSVWTPKTMSNFQKGHLLQVNFGWKVMRSQ